MWNLGDASNTLPFSGPEEVQTSMSFQYPLPSESSSNLIPGYHHPSLNHVQPPSPAQVKSPGINGREVAPAFESAKVKRSMSTPNIQGQASADAAALALSAEKRRNKLGYHRTSVACGHCRRRKIRCIAAPGDAHSRCSNCIRLKKDCQFFAVDAQPPVLESQRRASRTQSGAERASEEPSSPSTSTGQVLEIPQTLPYLHLGMPPIQDLGGPQMKRQRTESFSPESTGKGFLPPSLINPVVVTTSRNLEYTQPSDHGTTNWMATELSPSTTDPKMETSQSYWRINTHASPITPAFSPFTPNLQIPPWTPHAEASPREDNWSAPQRSISYGNLEGLHTLHQSTQYAAYTQPPPSNDHYTTKPRVLQSSPMYPPLMQTSSSMVASHEPLSATPSEPHQHPHSAQPLPPSSFPNWQQQFYSYQKSASAGPDHYPGWNGPPAGPPHEGGNAPLPPNYGYEDPSHGVFYQSQHPGR
ncbi:uncharacterized protein L3040_009210 [Drepanopeziza brunnea f. sp. 'multigermtubi']|uniref:uncharacterized protein n=1 Tax=Drepanopeziza brunnea f. sp. 'multigermtubi' TaxID=698441 RepID=UPI00239896CD|nr:hypothetical protein L3040_009210 [Drepanopeziza brunnea f. sp. 'multigermtubi']